MKFQNGHFVSANGSPSKNLDEMSFLMVVVTQLSPLAAFCQGSSKDSR